MTRENRVEYRTKMWPRSETSQATTVPKQIRAIRGAPTPDEETDVDVVWTINPETGALEVEFEEVSDEG